ncbi:MAG: N-acetylmuramoyl-L-alanine amidase [Niabella sp.]
MLTNKIVFTTCISCMVLLYACAPSQPARTNVLKPAPVQKTPQTGNKTPVTNRLDTQRNKSPYTIPEQVTRRDSKTADNKQDAAVAKNGAPVESAPVYEAPEGERPAARTPQYYRLITDSIQQVSAKSTYYRMTDSLSKIMSRPPTNGKNPAMNADWYTTVNFNIRKPNYVILHHTAQTSAEQTLFTFSISRTNVSAHYVIGRDGQVYQMLNDYLRAWHSGSSKWGSITDMNSCSLGIEIDNSGTEPFSDAQINALIKLLGYLKKQYDIPQANFIAHSDIAPTRKNDPSQYFPWKKLADAGFGYWYDSSNLAEPPADFNTFMAMRVIGYDVSNQSAAIKAFKLHYIQNDLTPTLTDFDKKVLYNIYRKY